MKPFNCAKTNEVANELLTYKSFTNGLGDLDSIPGRVIPKTLKMALDSSFLNTQQYKVLSRCSSYWKGSLLVALDYGHQRYFTNLHEIN